MPWGKEHYITLLTRPGWLVFNQPLHRRVLDVFYYETGWMSPSKLVDPSLSCLFLLSYGGWTRSDRAVIWFIEMHSLATTLWVFPRHVLRLTEMVKSLLNVDVPLDWDNADSAEFAV